MNTFDAIKTRRSTRRYLNKKLEEEKLQQIIEAGIYAPSGGNNQSSHIFVIDNKDVLNEIAILVQEEFSKMEVYEGMYKSLVNSIHQSKIGKYRFHYDAPVLIVVANLIDYGNALADSVCIVENMMIMANELDLGSCYINQLKWLNENERIISYFRNLGLEENMKIYASVSIGYPDSEDGKPIRTVLKRKGNHVTFVK